MHYSKISGVPRTVRESWILRGRISPHHKLGECVDIFNDGDFVQARWDGDTHLGMEYTLWLHFLVL